MDPKSYLILGTSYGVSRLIPVVETPGATDQIPDVRLPISGSDHIHRLAYDPVRHNIFWIERKNWTIRFAPDNDTKVILYKDILILKIT